MAKIKSVIAREILDSRGLPTIEVDVTLSDGAFGRAAVPSGASTGSHEALELRDKDARRFNGKGVLKAVRNAQGPLAAAARGLDAADQRRLDAALIAADGTANKSRMGANAILGVSLAACRAQADSMGVPLYERIRGAFGVKDKTWLLPTPMLNIINGGRHADNGLAMQEFMIVPVGAKTFSEAMRLASETYWALKALLHDKGLSTGVGDEGGFAPRLASHEEAIELILAAIAKAGHSKTVRLALDAAASEFYKADGYHADGKVLDSAAMSSVYADWCARYPIVSVEDGLAEDDWAGWTALTARLTKKVRLVGDDIFVTNRERLERAIAAKVGNAILIKLNQIGTLTETADTVLLAQRSGYAAVISHRSGETEDGFIADLAVALNAGAIKTGAPCRSERLAKYNQLLRIEESLSKKASYAGKRVFSLG